METSDSIPKPASMRDFKKDYLEYDHHEAELKKARHEPAYYTGPDELEEIFQRLTNPPPERISAFTAEPVIPYETAPSKPKSQTSRRKLPRPASTNPTSSPSPKPSTPFNIDDFLEGPYRDAAWFCKLFKPFTRYYQRKIQYAGGSQWIHKPSPLTLKLIQSSITQGYERGWYSSFRTPVLGLDIDFHHTPRGCWNGFSPSQALLDLYNEIINAFGYYPSLICKSPRGLHIYYLLSKPILYSNLKQLTEQKLANISATIEIKPSPKTGLRIPTQKWMLAPESFSPLGIENPIDWESMPQYSLSTLFGSDYRRQLQQLNFSKDDSQTVSFTSADSASSRNFIARTPPLPESRKYKRLLVAERKLLPFTNNNSNEILCQLIPKYRALNISMEAVIALLQDRIRRSLEYTNELTDPDILERRVISFYESNNESFTPKSEWITELPEHLEELILSYPGPKQRCKGIRQYLLGLLNWKALQDKSITDYAFRARMDDIYPYYSINRKNGFYPLPSKVQKSWNKNYNSLLPWLIENGILKDSGLPYSPGANICKYYEIYID